MRNDRVPNWIYYKQPFLYLWTPWRNGSASDSRSEGCVFESRRGQRTFLLSIILITICIKKNVKEILKGVKSMKQVFKIDGKWCFVESCLSPLYALAQINIDEAKGGGGEWKRLEMNLFQHFLENPWGPKGYSVLFVYYAPSHMSHMGRLGPLKSLPFLILNWTWKPNWISRIKYR